MHLGNRYHGWGEIQPYSELNLIMIIQFILVFFATVIVDWLWGLYIIHTSNKEALKASIYGTMIALMGSFVTISYMQDRRNLIAVAFGDFI